LIVISRLVISSEIVHSNQAPPCPKQAPKTSCAFFAWISSQWYFFVLSLISCNPFLMSTYICEKAKSYMLIRINEIINVNSYKGTVDSFTFHGTFCFHPLNKLSHHITWPNITFLKSRSTYISIYDSMCAVECVCSQTITSFPNCRMRYRQSTSTNTSHFRQHIL